MIEVLTVIPHDEITTIGFQFLRSKLRLNEEDKPKLDSFFAYFEKTWMGKFRADDWNIHRILHNEEQLANRTNNPLEHYNRHFNSLFTNAHPNLKDFVFNLRADAERQFQEYQNCQSGVSRAPPHSGLTTFDVSWIPAEYLDFKRLLEQPNISLSQSVASTETSMSSLLVS